VFMRLTQLGILGALLAVVCAAPSSAQEKHPPEAKGGHDAKAHPPKYKGEVKTKDGAKELSFDLQKEEHQKALLDALLAGDVHTLEADHPPEPMAIVWDLGLWAIVVFVLLILILRKAAWGPMLDGLQKREENIRNAVEEAKKARAETERITAE